MGQGLVGGNTNGRGSVGAPAGENQFDVANDARLRVHTAAVASTVGDLQRVRGNSFRLVLYEIQVAGIREWLICCLPNARE